MNKYKIHILILVSLIVIAFEALVALVVIFIFHEANQTLDQKFKYDRLNVFLLFMLILLAWNIITHYKIYKSVKHSNPIPNRLISYHYIAGVFLSLCLTFIVLALSYPKAHIIIDIQYVRNILLGLSVLIFSLLINYAIILPFRNYKAK